MAQTPANTTIFHFLWEFELEGFHSSYAKIIVYFLFSVPKCLSSGIITQIFPLHDKDKLKALEHKWIFSLSRKQPLGNTTFTECLIV